MNNAASRGVRTSPTTNTAVIVVLLVALAAAGLALRSISTETEVLPTVTLPDPTHQPAAAVVISHRQSGGFSLLGLDFGEMTRTVSVQLYAQAGCFESVDLRRLMACAIRRVRQPSID